MKIGRWLQVIESKGGIQLWMPSRECQAAPTALRNSVDSKSHHSFTELPPAPTQPPSP